MADPRSKSNTNANDGLALIIGGLFVLALVFATYSYFNRNTDFNEEVLDSNSERISDAGTTTGDSAVEDDTTKSLGDRIRELFNSQRETTGDINGDAMAASDDEELGTGGPMDGSPDAMMSYWTATDYNQGDISSGDYQVQSGDTLWEIAEAVYGNGAEWTRILNANAQSIGYLPNGQQALIYAGQTLVLP